MFSTAEVTYIKSQPLARIATVSPSAQPDVAPVSFQFDGQRFFIGGFNNPTTMKYKNVQKGSVKVALAVDDLASTSPWVARGIKIHGVASIVERDGRPVLQVTPKRHWSWGIEAAAFKDGKPVSRKVAHAAA
ncbi:MAG: PPOX class F420-dependent oxidoreductase [Chloroflexota bacterium]